MTESEKPTPLTPEEAIALMVRAKDSVGGYKEHQAEAKLHNHFDLYPPYDHILKAKQKCFPSDEFIKVSEDSVIVDFTSLIHHTFSQTCSVLHLAEQCVFDHLDMPQIRYFTTESKVGSDGTSGLSDYKFNKAQSNVF